MSMTKEMAGVAARFDLAATSYHARATVQAKGAAMVMDLVEGIAQPQSILDVGCGTGLLTGQLRERFPEAKLTALDISEKMIAEASKRLDAGFRIQWTVGTVSSLPADARFDVVASNAALHWMRPLENTFRTIRDHLCEGGLFVFALMLDGTLGELHAARRAAVPDQPVGRPLPVRDEIMQALEVSGFRSDHFEQKTVRVNHPDAWSMMKSIHEQGLTGGDISHGQRLLTRKELVRVAGEYDRRFEGDSGVPATYEIGLVRARL